MKMAPSDKKMGNKRKNDFDCDVTNVSDTAPDAEPKGGRVKRIRRGQDSTAIQCTEGPTPREIQNNTFDLNGLQEALNSVEFDRRSRYREPIALSEDDVPIAGPSGFQHPLAVDVHLLQSGESPKGAAGVIVSEQPGEEESFTIFSSFLQQCRELLRTNFGRILNINRGCIIAQIAVTSPDILENYKRIDTLTMLKMELKKFLLSHNRNSNSKVLDYVENLQMCVNKDDVKRLVYFYQADTLKNPVRFTFCPEQNCWFWSADNTLWMRENVFVVQFGAYKGQKLSAMDMKTLMKLWQVKTAPKSFKECIICKYYVKMDRKLYLEDTHWQSVACCDDENVHGSTEQMPDLASEDLSEVETILNKDKVAASLSFVESLLTASEADCLSVAVVGAPRAGKSSFIDAARGLDAYEETSAVRQQRVSETICFKNNINPGIVYYELPSPSTLNVPEAEYKSLTKWSKYDMFVLICGGDVTKDDLTLSKLIKEEDKYLIFVRTKTDRLLPEVEQQADSMQSDEDLENLAFKDISNKLRKAGVVADKIYVISSVPKENVKFLDFPLVLDTLIDWAPAGHKKGVALALGPHSETIIEHKETVLKKLVWQVALGSALANVVPIAGYVFDLGLLSTAYTKFKECFGVDKNSVKKTVDSYRIDTNRFSDATKALFTMTIVAAIATISQGVSLFTAVSWGCFLGVVGVGIVAPINYLRTRQTLNRMIDNCGEASKDILGQVRQQTSGKNGSIKLHRVGQNNPYHRTIPN